MLVESWTLIASFGIMLHATYIWFDLSLMPAYYVSFYREYYNEGHLRRDMSASGFYNKVLLQTRQINPLLVPSRHCSFGITHHTPPYLIQSFF